MAITDRDDLHAFIFTFQLIFRGTSSFMLNRSSENKHVCLFPDLSENAEPFLHLFTVLVMSLQCVAFIILSQIPLCLIYRALTYETVLLC